MTGLSTCRTLETTVGSANRPPHMAREPRSNRPRPGLPARRSSTWHAVSVVARAGSCERARGLRAQRFLSSEAPRLPMAGCSTPGTCPCAYKHHPDRRGPPRREEESSGLRQRATTSQERREDDA